MEVFTIGGGTEGAGVGANAAFSAEGVGASVTFSEGGSVTFPVTFINGGRTGGVVFCPAVSRSSSSSRTGIVHTPLMCCNIISKRRPFCSSTNTSAKE